ncbi:hypothetical protein LXL04_016381 [Taraxacum kok-saghyz]
MYFRVKRILVVNENIGIVVMVLTNMVYNSMAVLSCGLVGFCRIHYSLILRGHGLDRFSINTFGGCKFYCSIILLSHVYQGHKWNDYTRKGLSNWRLKNWLSGWDWNGKMVLMGYNENHNYYVAVGTDLIHQIKKMDDQDYQWHDKCQIMNKIDFMISISRNRFHNHLIQQSIGKSYRNFTQRWSGVFDFLNEFIDFKLELKKETELTEIE